MKILIPVTREYIAPRFDTATEALISLYYDGELIEGPRSILIAEPSADAFCDIAIKERITTVICCGIEEEHFLFLQWRKIEVIDGIIGPWQQALQQAIAKKLAADTIIGIKRDKKSKE